MRIVVRAHRVNQVTARYKAAFRYIAFADNQWMKIYSPEKTIHSTKDVRQEVLWVNYNISELNQKHTISLFSQSAHSLSNVMPACQNSQSPGGYS